ncbi:hypothetical protein OEA41_003238 [Lepraria neglecta]|uniref:Uncharacterized protein n=1 Tax=Lepraria neglecta TaxID=209136 RepID=A0AAD9Z470_9LECA|nr:hypothetical protein OEA41_003238 [Lepraria neglecta]
MAMVEAAARPPDRHSRRRPFSNWMKRLANLKYPSSDSAPNSTSKRNQNTTYSKSKKTNAVKNNPYPISGKPQLDTSLPNSGNGHLSFCTPPSGRSISYVSPSQSKTSIPASSDGQQPPTIGKKSIAPTISTNNDTLSDAANSKAGTTATAGGAVSSNGMGGGEGSTFSSPAPSVRSLTTTLTTMQSTAPSNLLNGNNQGLQAPLAVPQSHHSHQNSGQQFSHQFPSSPASAVPFHVVNTSGGHPATYTTATANDRLTDNASIMTLASSSKRRRRNSLDTNASVRALAPSSLFGGSRESLPLSVLSSTHDQASTTGHHQGRQVSVGLANAERASVYSSSGIAPALPSERNSYYAGKQNNPGDGGSVRSGLVGHGRTDSITRSITGLASTDSPLASPKEAPVQGRISRRNSGWGEVNEEEDDKDGNDQGSIGKKRDD